MNLIRDLFSFFDGEVMHWISSNIGGLGFALLIFLGILLPTYLLYSGIGKTTLKEDPKMATLDAEPTFVEADLDLASSEGSNEEESEDSGVDPGFIIDAQMWSNDARLGLMQLGIHIKNILKEAHTLAITAGKSKIEIDETLEYTAQLLEAATELQPLLPTLSDNPDFLKKATALSAALKNLSEKTYSVSKSLASYHPETVKVTEALNSHVTQTTQTLLGQAKIIQEFKERCGRLSR